MHSHRNSRPLAGLLAAAVLALAGTGAQAAAEPSGLDPELSAKVARERMKQTARARDLDTGGGGGPGAGNAGCGQVDIGNDSPGNRTAAQRLNERNKTVIVTGPVINAARCR
jgi:hypothetical protein